MKNFEKLLLILFITMLNMINVKAASNPYPQTTSWGDTNCTWYAWQKVYERTGIALPAWGNAKDWYNGAQNAGFSVGTTPRANSIAVWTNCDGVCATYGHVGYVESVGSDSIHGTILYIRDSSYNGMNGCPDTNAESFKECIAQSVDESGDTACKEAAPKTTCPFYLSDEGITGYIYLDNAPKTAPTTTKAPTTTTTTKSKSNNANLSNIKIENIKFNFDKEKTNYEIEVKENIDKINIIATLEDDSATITGDGEHNLKLGENEIVLNVVAEDGTKKDYTIKITRKAKKTTKKINLSKKEKKNNNKIYYFCIAGGIFAALLITIFIIIKNRKKSTKKETPNKKKRNNK